MPDEIKQKHKEQIIIIIIIISIIVIIINIEAPEYILVVAASPRPIDYITDTALFVVNFAVAIRELSAD